MVGIVHLPLLCPCHLIIMEADKSRGTAVIMAGNVDCRGGRMPFCYRFFPRVVVGTRGHLDN